MQVHDNMLTADFVTRGNPADPERVYTFGSDFYGMGELRDFQVYADGAYFSVDVGGEFSTGTRGRWRRSSRRRTPASHARRFCT